jgi:hypothetical protein
MAKELPPLICMSQEDNEGFVRTKPLKELIRELITNYNQLIEYLENEYGRTESKQ